jgi:hypothetical protein
MTERERWLQSYLTMIDQTIERIKTMNEAQVLRTLQSLRATQEHQSQTLAFLSSVSLPSSDNSNDELTELKKQLNAAARRAEGAFDPMTYIEDALKERLKALRRQDE